MNSQKRRGARRFIRLFEGRSALVFSAVLFRFALEVCYALFVSERFAYQGFSLDFSLIKYVESWLIYISVALTFPASLTKPSDYLMTFIGAGVLAPTLVQYAYSDQSRFALYCLLMGVLFIQIFRNGRAIRLPVIRNSQLIGIYLLVAIAAAVSLWYVASGAVAQFNLDLTKVYDFRRPSLDVAGKGFLSYINIWASKVAGPVLLAYFLWKKMYAPAIVVIALHVFWFGVSAHKSILFYPILVLFVWFWFSRTKALSLVYFGMTAVVVTVFSIYVITGDVLLASLFVRRVFFVVANNAFAYYEFFGENALVYWSNAFTSSLIDYPYHVSPAELIGQWRGTESHANNTFLATGYMHAGVFGVALYGFTAGLLFRLIDSIVQRGIPLWVGVAVIIVPSYALIVGADLPTALLTHGVGLCIFALYLIREPSRRVGLDLRERRTTPQTGLSRVGQQPM